jgi:hypothetical protein
MELKVVIIIFLFTVIFKFNVGSCKQIHTL